MTKGSPFFSEMNSFHLLQRNVEQGAEPSMNDTSWTDASILCHDGLFALRDISKPNLSHFIALFWTSHDNLPAYFLPKLSAQKKN